MEVALPSVLGALVVALGTYLVAARRFSGKVASSEAADLWRESASLREWTSNRMKEQDNLISELRGRIAAQAEQNTTLVRENGRLAVRVEACEGLADEITRLTEQLATANRRLAELGGSGA